MPPTSSSPLNTATAPHNFGIFRTGTTANVIMSLFPLWTHEVRGVLLPEALLFEHVPLHRALVRHWIDSEHTEMGGLLLPRDPFDMDAKEPFLQVTKEGMKRARKNKTLVMPTSLEEEVAVGDDEWNGVRNPSFSAFAPEDRSAAGPASTTPPPLPPDAPCLRVDITLFIVRRELEASPALQPFDPARWDPASYAVWRDLHTNLAPVLHDECRRLDSVHLPRDAAALLRRVMHTHFDDCGLVFGALWWGFGLGAMAGISLRTFMRGMLTDMFMVYHVQQRPPPVSTLFNPRTLDRGQRMCASCLALMLGSGRMMRCPCGLVYYCDRACQVADWRVHRVVCRKKGGGLFV